MSEMGIAEQLYRGSENLDLMRRKMVQIFSMIFGLVYPECDEKDWQPDEGVSGLIINGPGCQWNLYAYRQRQHYVMCVHVSFGGDETKVFSTNGVFTMLGAEDVQMAYESLDAFVEGMIKTFPTILVRGLKPFMRAAEKEL